MISVYIHPSFAGPDRGEGGIRRIVEAQLRHLPAHGIEIAHASEDADILAAHVTAPDAWFKDRRPMVAHHHGFYWRDYDWRGDWHQQANKDVMRLVLGSDAVTVPSHWIDRIVRRHTARSPHVIPHGLDLEEWTPVDSPEPEPYVLWNKTRVDAVCNPTDLRELAMRLPDVAFRSTFCEAPPANVEVIGRQPYEKAREQVRNAGVYLATALETFGIGTLEALASGIPVVGWRWGGQVELIDHLKDGYLATPGDYEDLARGIRWALAYRAEVSGWAQEKAKAYAWSDVMERYADLYRDLVTAQAGRPLVSVVVTAYEVEPWLGDCLKSVQTQSLADFEAIIVDDASPDDGATMAQAFADTDPRFRLIRNESNLNVADARNRGIREAQGRYVFVLDGDDRIAPDTLEILADALETDRDTGVAYGGVLFTRELGGLEQFGRPGADGHSGWPVDFDLARFLERPGQPMAYASMFRREAWAAVGGFRRRVRSSEDCDFYLRLASYGWTPRKVTNADTLIYRLRQGSRSDTEGHADAENKAWFPWARRIALAPAGATRAEKGIALDDPLIAVVIPVGPGHAHLVKDAVDSVEAQTFRAWECIVVNDTGRELPELPAWCIVLEDSSSFYDEAKHMGPAMARNLGIAEATAPYFLALDADDFLEPEALAALFAAEQQAGGRDVIYSDFWSIYEGRPPVREDLRDWDCQRLLERAIHGVTCLVPRQAWAAVDGYESMAWEDWDFAIKLAASGYCSRRVAAPLWCYRKDTGTVREMAFARREESRTAIYNRWGDYIKGEKQMAGCSSCGGRTSTIMPMTVRRDALGKPEHIAEGRRIEYIGPRDGKQAFRGKYSGELYLFQRGRPRWTHTLDAEGDNGFLKLWPDQFKLAPVEGEAVIAVEVKEAPALTAPGPRKRQPRTAAEAIDDEVDVGRPLEATGGVVAPVGDLPPPPPGRKL